MEQKKTTGHTVLVIAGILAVFVALCLVIPLGIFVFVGASDPATGQSEWVGISIAIIAVGLVVLAVGVGLLVFVRMRRPKDGEPDQLEIVQEIELSGDIALEKLKCQNCSAELDRDSVSVQEGAIFISCPYCGTAYQMVEEPKW